MSRSPSRPSVLAGKIFSAGQAVDAGLITRSALRSSAWQRVFQGVYADADLPLTHRRRCRAAIEFVLPPGSVIAGRSAAAIHGVALVGPDDPVEVLLPTGVRAGPARGLVIHHGDLFDGDLVQVRGIPVTGAARTAWDLTRWLDPVASAMAVDRMLAAGAVIRAELAGYAERRSGERGRRAFDRMLSLVDGRAESPPESELRIRLVLAGIPTPEPQHVIRGVARVDLGWPEYRLAVEYDGLWHVGSGEQMYRDRQRLNRLVGAGWLVLHVTARQLREGFPQVLTEVREALLARGCPRSELSSRGRRIRAAAASGITAVSKKQGPSRA